MENTPLCGWQQKSSKRLKRGSNLYFRKLIWDNVRQTEERDQKGLKQAGGSENGEEDKEEYWGSRVNRCCAEDVRAAYTPLLSVTDTGIVMPFTETVRRKNKLVSEDKQLSSENESEAPLSHAGKDSLYYVGIYKCWDWASLSPVTKKDSKKCPKLINLFTCHWKHFPMLLYNIQL